MQQSQRVNYNHALNHAIDLANFYNLPLVCFFSLNKDYKEANERSYFFMLEGLIETKKTLTELGITFVLRFGKPSESIISVLDDAQALVMDKGYLRHQRLWRKEVVSKVIDNNDLFIDMVDTDLIVPVDVVSNKSEYGAYTLRPKIKKLYESFRDFKELKKLTHQKRLNLKSDDDLRDIDKLINMLDIDKSIFDIIILSLAFYVLFAYNNVIDSIFYGIGKTQYMLFQSIVINTLFYGGLFIFYITGHYQPTLMKTALMFAGGIAFDSLLTYGMFVWMLRKDKLEFL